VPHQVQAEACVVEKGQVRTGVAQTDQAVRVVEHAADRFLVGVQKLRGEHRAQVLGEREIEHDIEWVALLSTCDVGDAPLLVPGVRRRGRLDDLHLVPLTVEQPKGCGGSQFSAHAVAERGACEHHPQSIVVQTQRLLPAFQALHGIRRSHREVHRQGTARHLSDQPVSLLVGRGDRVEIVEHGLRIGAAVQKRSDHHGTAAVGGERFKERQRGLAPLGDHVHASARLAHRGD
jgi:hypothetical protein